MKKYPCKCQTIINERIAYGLTLIDKLTEAIISEENIANINTKETMNKVICEVDEQSAKAVYLKDSL